jgi:hypothetical protein
MLGALFAPPDPRRQLRALQPPALAHSSGVLAREAFCVFSGNDALDGVAGKCARGVPTMFLFKPDVNKLAKQKDVTGLLKVVLGKNQDHAMAAAPLLGKLLLELHGETSAYQGLQALRQQGGPPAVLVLSAIVRSDYSLWARIKTEAAGALYELGAQEELRSILTEIKATNWRGNVLHDALSETLVELAVKEEDTPFVAYLLLNGSYRYEGPISAGYRFLAAKGGASAVRAVVDDPSVFSRLSKQKGLAVYERVSKLADAAPVKTR